MEYENIADHPRFGKEISISGLKIPEQKILDSYWVFQSDSKHIVPETVLEADVSKQDYAMYPRKYYVDILKVCRTCSVNFVFFAKEQKYWYEDLRLFVDADCVNCFACRQEIRRKNMKGEVEYTNMPHINKK